jgi:predicted DNA-binding transcriptional regulator AlpA
MELLITSTQVREKLRIGRDTLRRLRETDAIFPKPFDATGAGRKLRWSSVAIDAWLARKGVTK